jgi:tRNA threonylcarbamoyladenosine biosynthesis protein TsaE
MLEFPLSDAGATERLGAALARSAPWGAPQSLTVFLQGELGAGKTTLARGLLRELGVQGTVRSPSYTMLETYEPAGHRVLHLDLYRLRGADELETLGLRDELAPGVMLVIEWPERAAEALPGPDLRLGLSHVGAHRKVQLESVTAVGQAWVAGLQRVLKTQN